MKLADFDELMKEHQCEIKITPIHTLAFKAYYSYKMGDAWMTFTLLSEVADPLIPVFKKLLRSRGLTFVGNHETTGRPYLQNILAPDLTARGKRWQSLMPKGVPKYIRCYDNEVSFDRYTVVFCGRYPTTMGNQKMYLAMSENPTHPQGFGQHGFTENVYCDVNDKGWSPAYGRKNHIGTRIRFSDLPEACRRLVIEDYIELWGL